MGGWGLEGLGMSAAAAAGSGGMPGGLSAKQQKLFELRMRMVRVPLPTCALVVSGGAMLTAVRGRTRGGR